jgi:hypothetical protein
MCVTPAPELSTPRCDPPPILPIRPGVRRAPLLGIASDPAGGLAISAPGQNPSCSHRANQFRLTRGSGPSRDDEYTARARDERRD